MLAASFFATYAHAQEGATASVVTVPGGYAVWFPVDTLSAPPMGAAGIVVKGHFDVRRAGLMRPRTQFVTEMLKTVENL
jgi:hypothetical protein